jgi:hypothetical protein
MVPDHSNDMRCHRRTARGRAHLAAPDHSKKHRLHGLSPFVWRWLMGWAVFRGIAAKDAVFASACDTREINPSMRELNAAGARPAHTKRH